MRLAVTVLLIAVTAGCGGGQTSRIGKDEVAACKSMTVGHTIHQAARALMILPPDVSDHHGSERTESWADGGVTLQFIDDVLSSKTCSG